MLLLMDSRVSRRDALLAATALSTLAAVGWRVTDASAPASAAPEYIFPTSVRSVTDNFTAHTRRNPPSVNPGTDYACATGTEVVAVKAGRVAGVDNSTSGSGGRMVFLDHLDGTRTEYLHLSSISVAAGQSVQQGQRIAASGATGEKVDGPHLHISLKINGANVDFEKYVGGSGPSGGPFLGGLSDNQQRELLDAMRTVAGFLYAGGASVSSGLVGRDFAVNSLMHRLDTLEAAVFAGGTSMADKGNAISRSLAEINRKAAPLGLAGK
ncbi:M23 family metallopeptidase [Leifsonia sp. EB34]|uniref:M23 family metallopeptidase n=1 Tax=Leifsonia sp. EB34 TaxID=3156303 RepID=UPI0035110634